MWLGPWGQLFSSAHDWLGAELRGLLIFPNKKPLPEALVRNGHFAAGLVGKLVDIRELRAFHLLRIVGNFPLLL